MLNIDKIKDAISLLQDLQAHVAKEATDLALADVKDQIENDLFTVVFEDLPENKLTLSKNTSVETRKLSDLCAQISELLVSLEVSIPTPKL